jgi:DNA-binding transcriptional regulator YiaG
MDADSEERRAHLSPEAYRALIAALGLSQASAARLLGVDGRTSRRWAAGDRDVPAPAERFLRYLEASGTSPARVLRMLGEG